MCTIHHRLTRAWKRLAPIDQPGTDKSQRVVGVQVPEEAVAGVVGGLAALQRGEVPAKTSPPRKRGRGRPAHGGAAAQQLRVDQAAVQRDVKETVEADDAP